MNSDFTKETTQSAINFYAHSENARKRVAVVAKTLKVPYSAANGSVTFKIPEERRLADDFERYLVKTSHTIQEV